MGRTKQPHPIAWRRQHDDTAEGSVDPATTATEVLGRRVVMWSNPDVTVDSMLAQDLLNHDDDDDNDDDHNQRATMRKSSYASTAGLTLYQCNRLDEIEAQVLADVRERRMKRQQQQRSKSTRSCKRKRSKTAPIKKAVSFADQVDDDQLAIKSLSCIIPEHGELHICLNAGWSSSLDTTAFEEHEEVVSSPKTKKRKSLAVWLSESSIIKNSEGDDQASEPVVSSGSVHGRQTVLVQYFGSPANRHESHASNNCFLLAIIPLKNTIVEFMDETDDNNNDNTNSNNNADFFGNDAESGKLAVLRRQRRITTRLAAMDLWQCCLRLAIADLLSSTSSEVTSLLNGVCGTENTTIAAIHNNNDLNLPNNHLIAEAWGRAVQDGSIVLDLMVPMTGFSVPIMSPCVHVGLNLNCHVLDHCHPDQLPFQQRLRLPIHRRYQTARDVHTVLASLFPHSAIADTAAWLFGKSRGGGSAAAPQSTPPPVVTATQVYDLTDNVQFLSAIQQDRHERLLPSPPGLVPTMRPYQQYALEWMLQREEAMTLPSAADTVTSADSVILTQPDIRNNNNDEWKLAWWVIQQPPRPGDKLDNMGSMSVLMSLTTLSASSLSSHETTMAFFCPFTGWLTTSMEQACAMMTMATTTATTTKFSTKRRSPRSGDLDSIKDSPCSATSIAMETTTTTTTAAATDEAVSSLSNASTCGIRGGILADSMGLGKTVEVLALILAHPCPPLMPVHSSTSTMMTECDESNQEQLLVLLPPVVAKRRLIYDSDNDNSGGKQEQWDDAKQQTKKHDRHDAACKVGIVGDLDEFGCADDADAVDHSFDGEGDDIQHRSDYTNKDSTRCQPDGDQEQGDHHDRHQMNENTTTCVVQSTTCSRSAVVTPHGKGGGSVSHSDIKERWMDDDVVGSCICGQLIGFSREKKGGSPEEGVVLCTSCQEPMHLKCTAFAKAPQKLEQLEHALLCRYFSNETLACRLCGPDECPCCLANQGSLVPSRATLIITPAAISCQWQREIERHTLMPNGDKPLEVIVYEGIEKTCKSSINVREGIENPIRLLHPRVLADADIVLITFDALQADLGHSDDNRFVHALESESALSLRRRKRYRVVPSPLTSIDWWRVCLDEAQRVETPAVQSAQMALKLHAWNRWCVSGTPVGRGRLEDLFGLLLFLRLEPFANKYWFQKCFDPSIRGIGDRIQHLLKHVFWRTTKNLEMVREQMGVPEMEEKKIFLTFSSIEIHFYKQQLEQTLSAAGDFLDHETSGRKLKALAENLHRLRAACCHPQVGSSGITKGKKRPVKQRGGDNGEAIETRMQGTSRILSMQEILERFIDDARQKCEEAQRLVVMHTNAMAAISRLKVEAKQRDIHIIRDSDECLLQESCKLYLDALRITEENAVPTLVIGEASVSGSTGFRSPLKSFRAGSCLLDWKRHDLSASELWSVVEFHGPPRKITQIRVRAIRRAPKDLEESTSDLFQWRTIFPKFCVFQVANQSLGGEFVDVTAFSIPHPAESENEMVGVWSTEGNFRTNKSKSWRIVIKSFHEETSSEEFSVLSGRGLYCGVEAEFYEDDIASDPLQRLHCLHNGALSFMSLLQHREPKRIGDNATTEIPRDYFSETEVEQRITRMTNEAKQIEGLYMVGIRSIHGECRRRLVEASASRKSEENELKSFSREASVRGSLLDWWDDEWWDDFLVIYSLYASESQQRVLCERLLQDLDGYTHGAFEGATRRDLISFPEFGDIAGLRTALKLRATEIRNGIGNKTNRSSRTALRATTEAHTSHNLALPRDTRFKCTPGGHGKCIDAIMSLSDNPDEGEMLENSLCHVCKADWGQTGPKCRHCKVGEVLEELAPDLVTMAIFRCLYSATRSPVSTTVKDAMVVAQVEGRAKKFLDVVDAAKREQTAAWRLWRCHLDLLNDLDELNQSKTAMRLTFQGEDTSTLTEEQLNAVVVPIDVNSRFHDHAAKQAMTIGNLRRAKETLQYLKNLSNPETDNDQKCVVCLDVLDAERSVLQCGHSFHSQCLDGLRKRCKGHLIACPMRCRIRTHTDSVMIASSKARNDGSRTTRIVKGSWGTKVTRLVSDVLDIRDMGEKGIVFSQWEDMLDILEHALVANDILFVRPSSKRQIGECTKRFRSHDCAVLLLNVKNGAEGLTVLEATHVFMIEPLMNCGLDSQAINRIHRIGQNKKTYIWRYIITGTIEEKLHKRLSDHSGDKREDSINDGSKSAIIHAGGIDGGFESREELLSILES